MPGGFRRSFVWQFFDKGDIRIQCKLCTKNYSLKSATGTLGKLFSMLHCKKFTQLFLAAHLRKHNITQLTIKSATQHVSLETKKELDKAILEWVIFTCQPFNSVEQQAFRQIFAALNIDYKPMSSEFLKKIMNEVYEFNLKKLHDELSTKGFTICFDGWY